MTGHCRPGIFRSLTIKLMNSMGLGITCSKKEQQLNLGMQAPLTGSLDPGSSLLLGGWTPHEDLQGRNALLILCGIRWENIRHDMRFRQHKHDDVHLLVVRNVIFCQGAVVGKVCACDPTRCREPQQLLAPTC